MTGWHPNKKATPVRKVMQYEADPGLAEGGKEASKPEEDRLWGLNPFYSKEREEAPKQGMSIPRRSRRRRRLARWELGEPGGKKNGHTYDENKER